MSVALRTYAGHRDHVFALAYSPTGRRIASAGRDRTAQVWDAETGAHLLTFRGHAQVVLSLAWSPDGQYIASGCTGGIVHVWRADTGSIVNTYRGHQRFVRSVAWSPDGKHIASGGDFGDSTVQVWQAFSGEPGYTHRAQYRIFAAPWSPDGRHIASGSFDGSVQVWDAFNGMNGFTYRGHSGPVYAVAWLASGAALVSAGQDATVQIWSPASGAPLVIYRGHSRAVKALSCSPDGMDDKDSVGIDSIYIASGGDDATIQVWSATSGEPGDRYTGHSAWVRAIAWSPAGRVIASASDSVVHLWSVEVC